MLALYLNSVSLQFFNTKEIMQDSLSKIIVMILSNKPPTTYQKEYKKNQSYILSFLGHKFLTWVNLQI